MDIVIGAKPVTRYTKANEAGGGGQLLEGRLLDVRPPRKRRGRPPLGAKERRADGNTVDPSSGSVMVLLVPDGSQIPKDFRSRDYRVIIRLVPRKS